MSAGQVQRVRKSHVDWLLERLTDRDWRIIRDVSRVRLLTSHQIERLCFSDLSGRSRSIVRARVLKRLLDWRVLGMLPRRIGGYGSSAAIYYLDSAGQILAKMDAGVPRHRFSLPSERFVRHTLAVSELYVALTETDRSGMLKLLEFLAEPAAWLADGLGGWLKPDAFTSIAGKSSADDWFIEMDLATEHMPTLRHKAETYLSFYERGQLGPNGVMPKVLFAVPDEHRQAAIKGMLDRLPVAANDLLYVTAFAATLPFMVQVLRE